MAKYTENTKKNTDIHQQPTLHSGDGPNNYPQKMKYRRENGDG